MQNNGKLVKVNKGHMNIRQMGGGEKTIVILPGWNVPLPTVYFAPLMRELAKKYTVCTIELFGYGHSDCTDREHTNENYVEEIREALTMAGLKPPYVLMPYSCSGIYSEYYAAKYPDEVEGLILLDSTSTAQDKEDMEELTEEKFEEVRELLNKNEMDIMNSTPEEWDKYYASEEYSEFVEAFLSYGYTKEEADMIITTPNHTDTLITQGIALPENVKEVKEMNTQIADKIPTLVFSSEPEGDECMKKIKDQLEKLGKVEKHVIIEGSDHVNICTHIEHRDIICKEVDAFLEQV